MTDYTRLSVAGSTRRAEVVVPSDEPLGTVLPRLLDLLDERVGTVARPFALVGIDGEQLDIGRSAIQLELLDGSALRLVRLDTAPPPPVVIDVTDAAADAHHERADRWNDRTRAAVGGSAIAIATAVAGLIAPFASIATAAWALGITLLVLLFIAVGVGMGRMPRLAACVASAAAGVSVAFGVAVQSVTASLDPSVAVLAGIATVALALSLTVALGVGVARRRGGATAGGTIGALLFAVLLALLALGVDPVATAGVVGTVAVFLTGLLPWMALSVSGLTGLDERVAEGERVQRPRTRTSIDDAYAALTWGVAATATAVGVTGAVLVVTGELWPCLLAAAFGLAAALRTRSFPLYAQVATLWAAVAVIAVAAVIALLAAPGPSIYGVLACLAVAILVAVGVLVRPRPHERARLRGLGNALETLAVVALLPLLLGALGIYEELLGLFRSGA